MRCVHHFPDKALCWNYIKNTLRPDEVVFGSASTFWFTCAKCKHDFQLSIDKIARRGQWCAFCANRKLCPVPQDCATCFEKTFAGRYPQKALYWSDTKNTLMADQVVFGSVKRIWFTCDACGHEFRQSLDQMHRTSSWCPVCARKNESKNVIALTKSLQSMSQVTFTKEVVVKCNGRNLRWDFVVTTGQNVFCIENDGEQHFSAEKTMQIRRVEDFYVGREYFADQRAKDLLKDDHIRTTNGLLFRVSYRQLRVIGELVEKMVKQSIAGVTGVVYMDEEAYKDWGPIEPYDIQ